MYAIQDSSPFPECNSLEKLSAGHDGWIRVWDLESIFNAKAIDTEADKALFLLDPMNEVKVEVGAILKTIVKSKCVAEDQNDWFIQVKLETFYSCSSGIFNCPGMRIRNHKLNKLGQVRMPHDL